MRIFVLSSRVPFPLEKGDKLRIYHQVKYLAQKHSIHLCCLSSEKVHPEAKKELLAFCDELSIIKLNKINTAWNLFFNLFTDQPFQVAYFYQKRAAKQISQKIQDFKPDHIYAQLIRTSEYVKNFHSVKKTIDYMDSLSKGMDRRAKNTPHLYRPLVRSEAQRLLRYENLIFEYFDHHTIISAQDRDSIWHQKRKNITIIPNGIDTKFFFPKDHQKTFDVLFSGNMSYLPNIDSAVFLAEEIFPHLLQIKPQSRLLLAGASPTKKVRNLASDSIQVSGWMNDIREAYWSSKVFVAPLRLGSGLQNKLLEAMLLKIPCITTSMANNALGAVPGQSIIIAETPKAFSEQIAKLLDEPDYYHRIAEGGRQHILDHFNWATATAKLEQLFYTE